MERIEEYLEAIYDIQEETSKVAKTGELAKILNVKPSSVTEMLIKLRDMGYVDYQPYKGAKLTRKGKSLQGELRSTISLSTTSLRTTSAYRTSLQKS